MIKTLRITSIVVVIIAGILFVFPIVFGARSDEDAESFINSPSVVEQFNSVSANKNTGGQESSPLVKQAEAFALYLNPPAKTRPVDNGRRSPNVIKPRPKSVSTKFTLVGTSFFPSNPEKSLAFIDEPGKGLRWVRQTSEVGHLIIDQVKDGLVVIRDGQRTYEIEVAQKPARTNLLEGEIPFSSAIDGKKGMPSTFVEGGKSGDTIADRRSLNRSRSPHPQVGAEDSEDLEELVGRLKVLQKSFKSDKTDSGPSPEEKAILMEELVSSLKMPRVSAEEAENLGDLGKKLKDIEEDPNQRP
jgi:hypothetical protein